MRAETLVLIVIRRVSQPLLFHYFIEVVSGGIDPRF